MDLEHVPGLAVALHPAHQYCSVISRKGEDTQVRKESRVLRAPRPSMRSSRKLRENGSTQRMSVVNDFPLSAWFLSSGHGKSRLSTDCDSEAAETE